ncbi:MAG: hypothetical protein ACTSQY_10100, partial [Candidatus Odinarchaeia archaeon]
DFFYSYNVNAIFNFSALRHSLFSHAVGPGAAIIFTPNRPTEDNIIFYCSPKPTFTLQDELSFIIEPQDIAYISQNEAKESEIIWKIAMWGTPRDHDLIKKLSNYPILKKISKQNGWVDAEGYIVGNRKYKTLDLLGKPDVSTEDLRSYFFDVSTLPINQKTRFYRWAKTNLEIYDGPHLLIRQSAKVGHNLISAVITEDAVFPQSIIGIHSEQKDLSKLIAICLAINSDLSLYFAMLTSGRWLVERDELTKGEIMSIPIPDELLKNQYNMRVLQRMASDDEYRRYQNEKIFSAYNLDKSEIALVQDTIRYTLDYFRNKGNSMSIERPDDKEVRTYMEILCDALNNQFLSLTQKFYGKIYPSSGPLRLISLYLSTNNESQIIIEHKEEEMNKILKKLDKELIEEKNGGVYIRRHLRRYSAKTVHIIKPNQKRYWKMSSALIDSDKIYADIMNSWRELKNDIK